MIIQISSLLNNVLSLNYDEDNFSLDIKMKRFQAEVANLSIEEVNNNFKKLPFIPIDSRPLGFGTHDNWYYLSLKNVSSAEQNLVVLIDNPTLDEIDIYTIGIETKILAKIGDSRENENLTQKALPHFELNIAKHQQKEILIRTKSTGTPNFPLAIYNSEDFDRFKNAVFLLWGGFIAVVIVMSLYNLVLFMGNSEKIYIWYVVYILLFLVVLSVLHGFSNFLFPSGLYSFVNEKLIFFYYWLAIALTQFTYLFFEKDNHPLIKKGTSYFIRFLALFSVSALILDEYKSAQLFFPIQSVIYCLCLLMIFFSAKKNLNWAKYYVISWVPLLVGAAIGTLLMIGKIEYDFWTRHATMLGVFFEMAFISLALAERIRVSESKRLFEATHDQEFKLPNVALVKECYDRSVNHVNFYSLSVMVISIDNFDYLKKSCDNKTLTEAIYAFIDRIDILVSNNIELLNIDPKTENQKVGILGDSSLILLLQSDDKPLIQKAIEELCDLDIPAFKSSGATFNFKYTIGLASTKNRQMTFEEISRSASLAVNFAKENFLPFAAYDKDLVTKTAETSLVRVREIVTNKAPIFLLDQEFGMLIDATTSSLSSAELQSIVTKSGIFKQYWDVVLEQSNIGYQTQHENFIFRLDLLNLVKTDHRNFFFSKLESIQSAHLNIIIWFDGLEKREHLNHLKKIVKENALSNVKFAISLNRINLVNSTSELNGIGVEYFVKVGAEKLWEESGVKYDFGNLFNKVLTIKNNS